LVLVALNTVILFVSGVFNDQVETILDWCNITLTICFFFELCIKIYAFSLTGYLADRMNFFDGVITILGVAEMISDL
jgi:hypothetical protein